ncbi:hypothetical protein G4Y79_18825 [Phototrophicus methaneseepsis]|uniref:Uncharacterized protein n=1 Tax=Phototrophicus methaneseepsis TaxID=2710758 RepID=A0A7S8E7D5_9CHLR|nr:hypothetical protein [Phototrophicus methaneseepsis]QPC81726.1 hypothetical protein G4Y79_18825 [Phototrophicus methaneseepsis]
MNREIIVYMELRAEVITGVWVIFILIFIRAGLKGKLVEATGRQMWLLFFLSILALSFWGRASEAALDQRFGGQPVALYLKFICLIWVCHLYLQMLQEVGSYRSRFGLLNYLAPAAIGLGLLSYILYVLFEPIMLTDLRLIIIGARDTVVLAFIGFGFMWSTLSMWRNEQIAAMRFKQTCILLFFGSFAMTTLGSISAAVMTIFRVGDSAYAAQVFQPFVYPTVLFFMLMLFPYCWIALLIYPQRLYTFYRLKRVERLIMDQLDTSAALQSRSLGAVWRQPERLEMAIYQTVIVILDCYPIFTGAGDQRRDAGCLYPADGDGFPVWHYSVAPLHRSQWSHCQMPRTSRRPILAGTASSRITRLCSTARPGKRDRSQKPVVDSITAARTSPVM